MILDEKSFVQLVAYGNAEQRFFRMHGSLFDVVTLPGTVATFFRQGAGGFVLALQKPYFIDPRTSVLQSQFREEGRDEPRHVRLAEIHGPTIREIFRHRALEESDLSEELLEETLDAVMDFQTHYAEESSQKLDQYRRLLGQNTDTAPLAPEWLTPPYFRAYSYDDAFYEASLTLARAAANRSLGLPVVPIICVRKQCLNDATITAIADDWREGFPARLLWVDKLDGYRDGVPDLVAFLKLVGAFSERGVKVLNLFGDYFSVMAMKVGLSGVGHGVGYGESRAAFTRGGGMPAERYYVPALHRFYPRQDAEILMMRVGDTSLLCHCSACASHIEDGVVRTSLMSREDLLSHFLMARRDEIEHCEATDLGDLLDELERTQAVVSGVIGQTGVDVANHLRSWRQAYRSLT